MRCPRRIGVLLAATVVVLAASGSQATVALAGPIAASAGEPRAETGVISSAPDGLATGANPTSAQRSTRVTRAHRAARVPAVLSPRRATTAASSSTLLTNFDGVSSLDSAVTNFGAEFEPPDQGLCAGNGFVVEMVNSAYRVYNMKGTSLAGPFNINKVFHDGFKQFTSDPRCHYDPATKTWFAVILFLNNASTASRIEIATNTGDPRGAWTVFHINTTHAGGPGCPCFGDQPTFGIDASNLYVTTNEFSILGTQSNGAQIYAISKNDLIAHPTTVHFVHYTNLLIGGAPAASVQPALTFGHAAAEYFLSSLDPNGTGDQRVGVWALAHVNAVSSGGVPVLSRTVIASEPYSVPPPALQGGSTSTLDSGDDRMQQVQFIAGSIWGALDTSVQASGDPMPRAGAAWFRITPTLNGSKLGGANLSAQGYVMSAGAYVLYPAIQANRNGHAAMVFTLTSANRFPSAAYAVLSGGTAFGSPIVVAPGTGSYDAKATRWGDYSWAVLDPAGTSVWFATEYMPPVSSQTVDKLKNWGTRVFQLSLG